LWSTSPILPQVAPSTFSANELLLECREFDKPNRSVISSAHCLGYIQGVMEAHESLRTLLNGGLFCVPVRGTWDQFRKIFMKYADEHPETLHRDAVYILVRSLETTFPLPCAPDMLQKPELTPNPR